MKDLLPCKWCTLICFLLNITCPFRLMLCSKLLIPGKSAGTHFSALVRCYVLREEFGKWSWGAVVTDFHPLPRFSVLNICKVIMSCLTPCVCVCFPMFVYILIYWPSEGLVELWQPLSNSVCMACGRVIHAHVCSQAKVILQSLPETMWAWEEFNNGYRIAKVFIDGDLGNSSIEACSTGVYIIYLNLNWWFLCSTWRLKVIPPWCLFVSFSRLLERADHALFSVTWTPKSLT